MTGTDYPLTDDQRTAFAERGWAHLPGLLSQDEVAALREVYMRLLRREIPVAGRDYCDMTGEYDRPVEEYLPVRDWGKPGNVHDLKLKWLRPTEEMGKAAQRLLDRFLGRELEDVKAFAEGRLELDKDELRNRLQVKRPKTARLFSAKCITIWAKTSQELTNP